VTRAVVDASVAAKWVVQEPYSEHACRLLAYDARHAPDHWLAEAGNVIWSKVFRGELTASDAEERLTTLLRAPIVTAPLAALLPRAYAISVAHSLAIYDSLYVALAERLDLPFITADARLVRRLSTTQALSKRTVWIGDIST
jgi:predicted nucleic acid-binding protein